MSQIYWHLEFLFSGGVRGAESHGGKKKKKTGNLLKQYKMGSLLCLY